MDRDKDDDLWTAARRATLGDLAELARRHRVMISINFSPYDEDDEGDVVVEPHVTEGSAR